MKITCFHPQILIARKNQEQKDAVETLWNLAESENFTHCQTLNLRGREINLTSCNSTTPAFLSQILQPG